ncbi:hypothetical protein HOLleu_36039 [Holothuria leucospilota]|uniref:Uncharacterized protein n=1 Tax=Holothuria leucospilota TaxID=206669 RepID=A0A9Q0YQS9_HOLLE|nr:hypothetical protein HOLleu_36039 [Holothuria leucospilota]
MRIFSSRMRDLYAGDTFGSHLSTGKMFTQLRNETRRNALVYFTIIPSFELIIKSIYTFFSNFEDKSYDDWSVRFDIFATELKASKERSYFVKYMHEEIAKSFKTIKDHCQIPYTQWIRRPDKSHRMKERWEMTQSVFRKVFWPLVGFSNFLVINYFNVCNSICVEVIFTTFVTFLEWLAWTQCQRFFNDYVDTEYEEDEVEHMRETIEIVSSALGKFMDGFYTVVNFFTTIGGEIIRLMKLGRAKDQELRTHFEVFKEKAKDIKRSCRNIIGIVPNIKSDFVAIPTEDKERLYVHKRVQEIKNSFLHMNPEMSNVTAFVLDKCSLTNFSFEHSHVNVEY